MSVAPRRRVSWRRIGSGAVMALLSLFLLYQLWMLCLVVWYNYQNPDITPIMREQLTRLQAQDNHAVLRYQWVDYASINPHLKRAVVASEDSGFMDHGGVEWDAIRQAWEYNQRQADRGSSRQRGGLCGGSSRDEYCRGRLLFPLTNHPPMSRGGRAAMFYSPSVDRVDTGRSSRLVCAQEVMFFSKGPSDGKTYRCHYVLEILFD